MQNLIYDEYIGRGLTLQTDEGEIQCQVFAAFRLDDKNDQKYIALLEMMDSEVSNKLLIYRFNEDENGTPMLDNIASDEEYTKVSNFLSDYMNYLDELEKQAHDHDSCGCGCGSCGGGCH